MTVHRRADWGAKPPTTTYDLHASRVRGVVVHWEGTPVPGTVYDGDQAAVAEQLRGVQRFHMGTRGYSDIAYNWAVDGSGSVWQLRGWNHRSGANGNNELNETYLAIVCLIGTGQKPSRAMLYGLDFLIDEAELLYPKALELKGHRDVRRTECPGPDLYAHVKAHRRNTPATPTPRRTPVKHVLYAATIVDLEIASWYLREAGSDDLGLVATPGAARAALDAGSRVVAVGSKAVSDLKGLSGVIRVAGTDRWQTGDALFALKLL